MADFSPVLNDIKKHKNRNLLHLYVIATEFSLPLPQLLTEQYLCIKVPFKKESP